MNDQHGTLEQALLQASLLMDAACADTACRDLYIGRARELLLPHFPEERYAATLHAQSEIDKVLRQARDAIVRHDLDQAKVASDRALSLRQLVSAEAATVSAVAPIYTAAPVAADPFTPALAEAARRGQPPAVLRQNAVRALAALEKSDATWATLYAARHAAVALFPLPQEATTAKPTAASASALQAQAMSAAESGNVEQLQTLLAGLIESKAARDAAASEPTAEAVPRHHSELPAVLSGPFPQKSVAAAQAQGFEQLEISAVSEDAAAAIAEFLDRHAPGASLSEPSPPREGVTDLRAAFDTTSFEGPVSDVMAETISLFAWQIYVNSGGLRYLPLAAVREQMLVEGFAEGAEANPWILERLGLAQRHGLSRREIEDALLRRGLLVLRDDLGLDPFAFRLVCIPADAYVRVGAARGWGKREEWTHFDGYRATSSGKLLALIGGSASFGGLADLCGISEIDRRENVHVRFAVVHRERLSTRVI